jgi:hypothetical protein
MIKLKEAILPIASQEVFSLDISLGRSRKVNKSESFSGLRFCYKGYLLMTQIGFELDRGSALHGLVIEST